MKIDLSLGNEALYKGCHIYPVVNRAGKPRLHLGTPAQEAVDLVRKNAEDILRSRPTQEPGSEAGEIILTGPTPMEIYLTVFDVVQSHFSRIIFQKGKERIVIRRE